MHHPVLVVLELLVKLVPRETKLEAKAPEQSMTVFGAAGLSLSTT
jgi:hypothetical protein